MTARRSKPSFASLLRHASRREEDVAPPDLPLPGASGVFHVDPDRVRLWSGLTSPTLEECQDCIAAIVREGQVEPVTVRPVFDDEHYEYEVIAGARDYVAVRYVREHAIAALELLVRVELVDDAAVQGVAARLNLPDVMQAAFGVEPIANEVAADLSARLDSPLGRLILATAAHIARAQAARHGDGLPPYPASEVMRLFDAVGQEDSEPTLALSVVDADQRAVTFRLQANEDMPPEMLARLVKAMVDGAAADGIAVTWASDPTAATFP